MNDKPTYQELENQIAELKKQNETLRLHPSPQKEEERVYYSSKTLNYISDPVFIKDDQSSLLIVNDAFCKLFGLSRVDIIGKTLAEHIPPEEQEIFLKIDKEVIADGVGNINEESLTVRGGETRTISTRKTRFIDSEGKKFLVGIIQDVTEQRIAEQALKENQYLYKETQKIGKMAGWSYDVESDQITFTDAIYEIYGTKFLTPDEGIKFYYPDDKEKVWNSFTEALLKQKPYDLEVKFINAQGDNLFVRTIGNPIIKNGKVVKINGNLIDITEQKTAEQKLKRNHNQQTLLADISQNLLSLDNLSEKINQTLKLIGSHIDVSRVYIFEDNLQGTETNSTFEWCNTGINPHINELQNVPFEVTLSFRKFLNEEGKVFSSNIKELPNDLVAILEPQKIKSILIFPLFVQNRFFGFIGCGECHKEKQWENEEVELLQTISGIISNSFERQILQKQLRESEIRKKLAIENTEAGVWDWNIQTGEVFFNDIWCEMLGYNKDEIEPNLRSWEKLVHPDDMPNVMKDLNKHMEGKSDFYENRHRLLTKSCNWKWVKDKGKIIEYDNNKTHQRAIGTHIDIDSQKKIEEELRNLNITKDKFFSIIAHDLRGPIISMMQISEIVSENDGLDEETLHKFLNSQKDLSKSTFQLLDNLLNWAISQTGKFNFNPEKQVSTSIFKEIFELLNPSAKNKNILLNYFQSEEIIVFADPNMIKTILRNLISNAIKFTNSNGRIDVTALQNGNFIEIAVSDNGVGMNEETRNKLFRIETNESTIGTADEKGSGLGLLLCKEFVEKHGGKIWVESELGKGSVFKFKLPLKKINE